MNNNSSYHIRRIGDKHHLSVVKDGEVYSDPVFPHYTKYLSSTNRVPSTVESYMGSIKRFFIYCLYFGNKENLALKDYVAQYKRALENGFIVYDRVVCAGLVLKHKVFASEKLQEATILKEWSALTSYYDYISDEKNQNDFEISGKVPADIFYDKLDKNYIKAKERLASARTGVKFSVDKGLRKSTQKRLRIFRDLTKKLSSRLRQQDRSYIPFPYKYFDSLLKIVNINDRAIFLIQGICSPRISQVLSMTNYDIWFPCEENNQKGMLWICRAQRNERPLYSLSKTKKGGHGITVYNNIQGRKDLLLEKYKIDSSLKPWIGNSGKYPIPVHRRDTSLSMLPSRKYQKLLFQSLKEVIKNNFTEASVGHPYVFQTGNGTIERRNYVAKRFKIYLKKLEKIHPEYDWSLLDGTHSLRHMFGQINADMFLKIASKLNAVSTSETRELERQHKHNTARSMGHSNYNSVNIYYRATMEVEDAYVEELASQYDLNVDEMITDMLSEDFVDTYNKDKIDSKENEQFADDELPF